MPERRCVRLGRRLDVSDVGPEVDGLLPLLGLLRQLRLLLEWPLVETVCKLGGQFLARFRAHLPLPLVVAKVDFGPDDGDRRTFIGGILNVLEKPTELTLWEFGSVSLACDAIARVT